MNQIESRISRELRAAAERLPESSNRTRPLHDDKRPRLPARGPLLTVAAMATIALLVGGVGFVLLRGSDMVRVGNSGSLAPDTHLPAASNPLSSGTSFDSASGSCSQVMPPATMYLGGPGWENNLAADGFMLSLPVATPPIELARLFVSRALVGGSCDQAMMPSIEAATDEIGRTAVAVEVFPPATPRPIALIVETRVESEVIGVTGVQGQTLFEVSEEGGIPVLRVDELPAGSEGISVRFRKGEDVWELLVPGDQREVQLVVPPGETDQYPDAAVQWVLFVAVDLDGGIADAGGSLIP